MNEQERADWLARTIDDLLRGQGAAEPPSGLENEELDAIMRVARVRLEAARANSHASLQYEGEVWRQVLIRLEGREASQKLETKDVTDWMINAGDLAADPDVPDALADAEMKELGEIVRLRRRMADEMVAFAAAHEDDVWLQVQSRIQAQSQRKGLFWFLRRSQRQADALAPALDGLVAGRTQPAFADSSLDELLQLGRTRIEMGRRAQIASSRSQDRLWTRILPRLVSRQRERPPAPEFHEARRAWPKFAAAAAAAALVVAALGPLPATGLAHHPATEFARFLADHAGVRESEPPPVAPADPTVVQGADVSTQDAAQLLGLPLREPSPVPAAFQLTSARFFPRAISADQGGFFLLTYVSADAKLLVFQESADASDIAVAPGSATDIVLSGGVPATYVQGSWQPDGGQFAWAVDGAQSIVFDRDGVRTVIQYDGPAANPALLRSISESMMSAAPTR